MNIYGQNAEDLIIEKYFGNRIGSLLSIGENDGKTLSNVLSSIEKGWSGVLIEPSKTAFKELEKRHEGNDKILCVNIAIGDMNGEADFYESGTHLGTGDTSLISTLIPKETERWKGTKYDNFSKTKTEVMTWNSFYSMLDNQRFNLISIDAEGFDLLILSQMDLTGLGCEMLIVEYNGKEFDAFNSSAAKHGLRFYDKNNENLIFVK